MVEQGLSTRSILKVQVLQAGPLEIRDTKATVAVQLAITPVNPDTSSVPLSSLYAERLVHCVKENEGWKIWRLGPTTNELAIMLASEPTSEGRDRLLAADRELAKPQLVRMIISFGDGFFQQGRYPAAHVVYRIAEEIAGEISDEPGLAAAERGAGNTLFYAHQNAQALANYQSSLKHAEDANDRGEIARSLDAIANVYATSRDTGKAFEFYGKSLNLATELGDAEEISRLFNNIGNLRLAQTEYKGALRYYRKSLSLKLRSGNDAAISIALYNVANALYADGRYSEALRNYEESLKRAEKIRRKAGLASIHRGMGDVYYVLHDDGRAALNYLKSLEFNRELGDTTGVVECLGKLSLIYYLRGDYQRALESGEEGLALAEKANNRTIEAQMLDRIGLALQAMGRLQDAMDKFQTSGSIRTAQFDERGAVRSLLYLAHARRLIGDFGGASACLDLGLKKARERKDWEQVMVLLTQFSDLRYALGNYGDSARDAAEASNLARRFDSPEIEWKAEALGGRAYLALRELKRAHRSIDQAIRIYEGTERLVRDGEYGFWPGWEGICAPYDTAIQLQLRQGNVAGAWSYYERAKTNLLRKSFPASAGQASGSLTLKERQTEERLSDDNHSARAALRAELRRTQVESSQLHALEARYWYSRKRYEGFESHLSNLHPALKSLSVHSQSPHWEQASRFLPGPDSAFLEFMVSQDSIRVFILRRHSGPSKTDAELQTYSVKIPAAELSSLVERYRAALGDSRGAYEQPAEELYDVLIRPSAAQLNGVKGLYVVPDGVLWDVPFAALRGNDGRLVIQQFSISYFPSFGAFQQTTSPDGPQAGEISRVELEIYRKGGPPGDRAETKIPVIGHPSLLALADPAVPSNVNGEWVRLPSGKNLPPSTGRSQEVTQIAELYGQNRSDVLLGPRASTDALREHAGEYDVIHIAAPAVLDDRDPLHSVILLSPTANSDDPLETTEIFKFKRRAGMAVFSATEIASIPNSPDSSDYGQALLALHMAWLQTGRPQLVLGRWITDSVSSSVFFSEFHRELIRSGVRSSSAAALRSAQLKMLAGNSFQHPFFWAGFLAFGCN